MSEPPQSGDSGPTGPPGPSGPAPGDRPRRRDRHGRGMRGPIAPPQVPLSATRAEVFDDLVRDSADRLERRWPQLAATDFAVQEVPRPDDMTPGGGAPGGPDAGGTNEPPAVPLGRVTLADNGADRVVIYRRPIEIRTRSRDERALLVHEVVVEQVAELLGLAPESVDPRYGGE